MPGSGVHRSVPEPSAKAVERTFRGRPGSLTWEIGASYGPVRSQWRLSAPRFVHHHRHRSYAGVWSAQIGPRAFRKGPAGGHSSGGPADLETLRKETRLEIQLEKLPGGVWLEAHWEVRLAAGYVEAQREEARYTVLGALSRSPTAPTTTLGPLSTENTGPFVRIF